MILYPGRTERTIAQWLIQSLRRIAPAILRLETIDLEPAAEHVLYSSLRFGGSDDRQATVVVNLMRCMGRLARAVAGNHPVPDSSPRSALVLITARTHAELWRLVDLAMEESDRLEAVVLSAQPRSRRVARIGMDTPTLASQPMTPFLPALVTHALRCSIALARTPKNWQKRLGAARADHLTSVLRSALPRLALEAAQLATVLDRIKPRVVICFNESGPVSRIAPAVASSFRIPSVDLPHAEAADPWGTHGATYDRVAVYGERAAQVMSLAGFAPSQIEVIGPLRFDPLISAMETSPAAQTSERRRILFASQPTDSRKQAQSADLKASAIRAALKAAAVVAPSELIIVPHPTETDDIAEITLRNEVTPADVGARIERKRGLHDLLPGAWLLTTLFSQSVFDAAVAGVPSISFMPTGDVVPSQNATDGITIRARNASEMSDEAQRLLDPAERARVVALARERLRTRMGKMDGRAASRAARVVVESAGGASTGQSLENRSGQRSREDVNVDARSE